MIKKWSLLVALALVLLPSAARAVDAGRFQTLIIKAPDKPVGLVYIVSDITGWTQADETMANELKQQGWLAVGIDLKRYRDTLAKGEDTCHDVGDELTSISQQVQRDHDVSSYLTPVIIGRGQGGTLAYAVIKQALPASFTAGFAIGQTLPEPGLLSLPQSLCDGPPAKKFLPVAASKPLPSKFTPKGTRGAGRQIPPPAAIAPLPVLAAWQYDMRG